MFESSGFISFSSSSVLEMKANGKVGPYKQVDDGAIPDQGKVLFALVHSEPRALLAKLDALRHIYMIQNTEGKTAADNIKIPYNTTAISSGFDTSLLVNFHETLRLGVPVVVKKVSPMILNPGSLMVTDSRIYYQPANINNVDEIVQSIDLHKIHRIFCRRYLQQQIGIELLMSDGSSVLFCFEEKSIRDHIYALINEFPRLSRNQVSLEDYLVRWQKKEITNFEYLMYLNYEAGRSNNDLTQYPVFPHILRDFTSKSLDFKAPETYRDLSQPVGALNAARLEHFKQRYNSMPEVTPLEIEEGMIPPFMYGTHYSTPGYALHYLVRVAPEHMLCLQAGKFDAADRMFTSIEETWTSVTNNPADLKELIPEFFNGTGEFLVNKDDLDLGYKQSGERLGDVELPPWAKSPKDFVKKNIKALESSYVSNNIHNWIDLIFGYKQQGKAAVDANNVFYHLTYEGSVDWDKVTSVRERSALEIQIQEFGQTPRQLFLEPHPRRSDDPNAAKGVAIAPRLSPQPHEKHTAGDAPVERSRDRRSSSPIHSSPAMAAARIDRGSKTPPPVPTEPNEGIAVTRTSAHSVSISKPPRPTSTDTGRDSEAEGAVHLLDDNFKSAVARELNGIDGASAAPPALIVTPPKSRPLPPSSSINSSSSTFTPSAAATAAAAAAAGGGTKKNIFGSAVSNIYNFFGGKEPSASTAAPVSRAVIPPDTPPGVARPTSFPTADSVSPVTVFYGNGAAGSGSGSRSVSRDLAGGDVFSQSREERASSSSNHSNPSNRRKRVGEVALRQSGDRTVSSDQPSEFYMSNFDHDSANSLNELNISADSASSLTAGSSVARTGSRGASGTPTLAAPGKSTPITATRIALSAIPTDDSTLKTTVHTACVTCISARSCLSTDPGASKRSSVVLTTCSRDGSLKVLQVDCGTITGGSQRVSVQTRRTFNAGGMTFGSSLASADDKYVVAGGADSHLYCYSIPNAGLVSKTPLHDDSISAMAVDDMDRMLVTGAIDASIKIWRLKEGGSMLLASSLPVSETFEHDNAITSLCLSHSGTATSMGSTQTEDVGPTYMAAGAEDGVLIVWDIGGISTAVRSSSNSTKDSVLSAFHQPTVMFSCQLGNLRRAVSAVQWIPVSTAVGGPGGRDRAIVAGIERDRFICSTIDGNLVCMDAQGKLVMMSPMGVGILCLAVENRSEVHGQPSGGLVVLEHVYIYGGCSDGSLRVWAMEAGAFVEKHRVDHALRVRPALGGGGGIPDYDPPIPGKVPVISAMCVCSSINLLITGGDNGAVRFWGIESMPYVN